MYISLLSGRQLLASKGSWKPRALGKQMESCFPRSFSEHVSACSLSHNSGLLHSQSPVPLFLSILIHFLYSPCLVFISCLSFMSLQSSPVPVTLLYHSPVSFPTLSSSSLLEILSSLFFTCHVLLTVTSLTTAALINIPLSLQSIPTKSEPFNLETHLFSFPALPVLPETPYGP